jgi:hypothetical protein
MVARWQYLAIVIIAIAVCMGMVALSDDAEARTATWDGGGGDNLASTAANWDLDTAPIAGDDVVIAGTKSITWDIAVTLGNLTLATGYSGTFTQGAVDFGYVNYLHQAGTMTGVVTNTQTCSGNWVKPGGSLTADVLRLVLTGESATFSPNIGGPRFHQLVIDGNISLINGGNPWAEKLGLNVTSGSSLSIASGSMLQLRLYYGYSYNNDGTIDGQGIVRYYFYNTNFNLEFGQVECDVVMELVSAATASRTVTLTADAQLGSLSISSAHASNTITLLCDGHDLVVDGAVIVGTRATLNSTGVTLYCESFNSKTGSWISNNGVLHVDGGSIELGTGHVCYDVIVSGATISILQDTNITNELSFIGLTASHIYGWYENGARVSSITTTASGTYSLGAGVFTWDNATLKITPVITPDDEWTHDDGSGNTYTWVDFHWWLGFDSDDDTVTWAIADCPWLAMYDEGMIAGVPNVAGNYSYNITAVASNGEVGTYSGYVLVYEFIPDPDWPDNPGDVIEINTPVLFVLGNIDVTMWSEYDPYYIEVTNDTLTYATVAGEFPMTFWATGAVDFNITTFSPYADTFLEGDLTSAGEDLYLRIGGFQPGAVVRHVIDGSLASTTVDGAGYLHLNITNIVDTHIELSIVITPPMFTTSPDIVAHEMEWYTYQVGVFPSDAVVTAVELPYWMYWDDETLSMVGLPRDPGTFECRLMATNGFGVSWQNWTIYIYTQDLGFSSNPLLVVDKFDQYEYDVMYYPPNADCKVLIKPIWLHFNEYTDSFDGQANQVGSFNVVIRITLGHAVAYQNFTIVVNDIVSPPSWLDTPSVIDMDHAMFYILLGVGVAFMLLVFYMRRKF